MWSHTFEALLCLLLHTIAMAGMGAELQPGEINIMNFSSFHFLDLFYLPNIFSSLIEFSKLETSVAFCCCCFESVVSLHRITLLFPKHFNEWSPLNFAFSSMTIHPKHAILSYYWYMPLPVLQLLLLISVCPGLCYCQGAASTVSYVPG